MKKHRKNDSAVTEILGTMLLLLISISLFSLVYFSIFTIPENNASPAVDIAFSFDQRNITLTHFNGEPLGPDTQVIILIDDITDTKMINELNNWDNVSIGDNEWNIGETLTFSPSLSGNLFDKNISISIIDRNSNSLVFKGDYYQKPVYQPLLQTTMNSITYLQGGPLVSLSAAGELALDNVSLSYRYSPDNTSWSPYIFFGNDSSYPWEWTFEFPNGTGWYEFMSRGFYKSKHESVHSSADIGCLYTLVPVIVDYYPITGDTSIDLNQTLSVTINDGDCDGSCMDLKWYTNASGSWQQIQIDTSIGNGTYTCDTTGLMSDYETWYYWNVSVTDGISIVNSPVYRFKTRAENLPPDIPSDPYPAHQSTDISLGPTLSWSCSDPEDDDITYDVYFSSSNPPTTKIASNQTGTIKYAGELTSGTTYYWKVVAWDEHHASSESDIWEFSTADWTLLMSDGFETGWGNYQPGAYGYGADVEISTAKAYEGSHSVELRDNSGDSSSFFHYYPGFNIHDNGYTSVKVEFYWLWDGNHWNNNEVWVLEFNEGYWWWDELLEIEPHDGIYDKNTWHHQIVYINETDYNFPWNARLKFKCDASSYSDLVYFDEIKIWAK